MRRNMSGIWACTNTYGQVVYINDQVIYIHSIFTQNINVKCTKSLHIEFKVTISREIMDERTRIMN